MWEFFFITSDIFTVILFKQLARCVIKWNSVFMEIIFDRFKIFLNKYRYFFPLLNFFIYILLLAMFSSNWRISVFLYCLTWLREVFFSPLYRILAQQGNYLTKEHRHNNGVFIKSNASERWTASSNNYRTCWKSWVSGNFKEYFNSREFYVTTK